jgi:MerR family transcriptional regulator, copper efflux regulator
MDQPIACTLSPRAYRDRAEELSALARRALQHRIDHGIRLTFDTGEVTYDRLRGIVAAEAECCPFLTMRISRAPDVLHLEITGPDEAGPIIAELFT